MKSNAHLFSDKSSRKIPCALKQNRNRVGRSSLLSEESNTVSSPSRNGNGARFVASTSRMISRATALSTPYLPPCEAKLVRCRCYYKCSRQGKVILHAEDSCVAFFLHARGLTASAANKGKRSSAACWPEVSTSQKRENIRISKMRLLTIWSYFVLNELV